MARGRKAMRVPGAVQVGMLVGAHMGVCRLWDGEVRGCSGEGDLFEASRLRAELKGERDDTRLFI